MPSPSAFWHFPPLRPRDESVVSAASAVAVSTADRQAALQAVPGLTNPLVFVDGGVVGFGHRLGDRTFWGVPVDSIDRIEVLKGEAAEAAYGRPARGGVIHVFTRSGDTPEARRQRAAEHERAAQLVSWSTERLVLTFPGGPELAARTLWPVLLLDGTVVRVDGADVAPEQLYLQGLSIREVEILTRQTAEATAPGATRVVNIVTQR